MKEFSGLLKIFENYVGHLTTISENHVQKLFKSVLLELCVEHC